jgi:hypothetical protein
LYEVIAVRVGFDNLAETHGGFPLMSTRVL